MVEGTDLGGGAQARMSTEVPADCAKIFENWDGSWPIEYKPVLGRRDGLGAKLETWAALGAIAMCGRLPERLLGGAIGGVARIARRVDKRHSDEAREFLRTALGDLPERELDEHVLQAYRHFLRVVVDSGTLRRRIDLDKIIERVECRVVDEVWDYARTGQPIIATSPHLGDWETAGAVLPRIGFAPLYAFARPPKNLPLSIALQKMRDERSVRTLPRRGGFKDGMDVLKGGASLGMMIDQRAHGRYVATSVFGRPALTERGVGVMLRRSKVPVAVLALVYAPGSYRYRLEIPRVFHSDEVARLDPTELAQSLQDEFEKLIRRYPDQYMWLHGRYRGAEEALAADGD